jgi:hypothetical protein
MKQGAFLGCLADETGANIQGVVNVSREIATCRKLEKSDDHQVSIDEAADVIVALCAHMLGDSAQRAAQNAVSNELALARAKAALLAGTQFNYQLQNSTAAIMVGCIISAKAMEAVNLALRASSVEASASLQPTATTAA